MNSVRDYYDSARQNEWVFRNILLDLKLNRVIRPGGRFIPVDLDFSSDLDAIFEKYSRGNRIGIFSITDFQRPTKERAYIRFCDVAPLSGGGIKFEYFVDSEDKVFFLQASEMFLSLR